MAESDNARCDPENLARYFQAVDAASQRTRWTYIALVVTAILAFAAHWNGRHEGWSKGRLTVAQNALQFLLAEDPERYSLLQGFRRDEFHDAQEWLSRHNYEEAGGGKGRWHGRDVTQRLDIEVRENSEGIARASGSIADLTHSRTKVLELMAYIEHLTELRLEHVFFVDIPFLGITFDVNDLGVFAGFAFVVLLLMVRISHAREVSNVVLTFDFARACSNQALRDTYEHLSMFQIFTLPRPPLARSKAGGSKEDRWQGTERRHTTWRYVPVLPFFLPLLVQAWIVAYNQQTIPYAAMVSRKELQLAEVLSWVFFALILLMTIEVASLWRRGNRAWDLVADEIHAKCGDRESGTAVGTVDEGVVAKVP